MQEIINDIKNGKITRDNDESCAGGFWDYAGELVRESKDPCDEHLQAEIYYALWELADIKLEEVTK